LFSLSGDAAVAAVCCLMEKLENDCDGPMTPRSQFGELVAGGGSGESKRHRVTTKGAIAR
jgi:hypothetical protein